MIRQFLLDYSNFQVNSNVWFDRERNFIIFGQVETGFRLTGIAHMQYTVKLKQVLVDWNCAYAVYGQVETSFWLTEIALVLNEVELKQVSGWPQQHLY